MIDSLIFDWNRIGAPAPPSTVMLDDETLRDGLQSPSVRTPGIEEKIRILHLIDALGIDTADIGLPGAGPHVVEDVERLAREIVSARLSVKANCAARTHIQDILPIAEISQRTGLAIECCTFIGSSPIRQFTEGWTLDWLLRTTEAAITFAVKEGLDVMYVTEDTTRANPETLRAIYSCAIRAGAKRICVADTVGHATPTGASALVRFVAQVVRDCGADVGICEKRLLHRAVEALAHDVVAVQQMNESAARPSQAGGEIFHVADVAALAAVLRDQRGVDDTQKPPGHRGVIDDGRARHVAILDPASLELWVGDPTANGRMRSFDLRHELDGDRDERGDRCPHRVRDDRWCFEVLGAQRRLDLNRTFFDAALSTATT